MPNLKGITAIQRAFDKYPQKKSVATKVLPNVHAQTKFCAVGTEYAKAQANVFMKYFQEKFK